MSRAARGVHEDDDLAVDGVQGAGRVAGKGVTEVGAEGSGGLPTAPAKARAGGRTSVDGSCVEGQLVLRR